MALGKVVNWIKKKKGENVPLIHRKIVSLQKMKKERNPSNP